MEGERSTVGVMPSSRSLQHKTRLQLVGIVTEWRKAISWAGGQNQREQHFLYREWVKGVKHAESVKRGEWKMDRTMELEDWGEKNTVQHESSGTQTGSSDVTLSLSLSWNSHGNRLSTSPPQPPIHPPPYTPFRAFSCCGDGGSNMKSRREGGGARGRV